MGGSHFAKSVFLEKRGGGNKEVFQVSWSYKLGGDFARVSPLYYYNEKVNNWGFPGGSDGKESACNAGDLSSIPGSGRSPREGNGNPLQNSCLENPMDRGAWQATVHGVSKSRT